MPRSLFFRYSTLELMASNEKKFPKYFRGASKASAFRDHADLASRQIALLPQGTNPMAAHIPALVPMVQRFANYFGVDTSQLPSQISLLWYAGFLAKNISAFVLVSDILFSQTNKIAMATNLEKLGAMCGNDQIIGRTFAELNALLSINEGFGTLIYLNFYNRYRLRDGREFIYLSTVLADVKYLGLAMINQTFISLDSIVCLPRKTRKNLAENIHSFITHDLGHSFLWFFMLRDDKHLQLQNRLYNLVNRYLISHLIHYPEMQVFKLALVAIFLIVHEENFIGMCNEFKRTGNFLAPVLPEMDTKTDHFHHTLSNRFLISISDDTMSYSGLRNICESENFQCLETYETLVEAGVAFEKPDFKEIKFTKDGAEYKAAAINFMQQLTTKTNQAFVCFNEVAEHVLACETPDGKTYNTKFVRSALTLRRS